MFACTVPDTFTSFEAPDCKEKSFSAKEMSNAPADVSIILFNGVFPVFVMLSVPFCEEVISFVFIRESAGDDSTLIFTVSVSSIEPVPSFTLISAVYGPGAVYFGTVSTADRVMLSLLIVVCEGRVFQDQELTGVVLNAQFRAV